MVTTAKDTYYYYAKYGNCALPKIKQLMRTALNVLTLLSLLNTLAGSK